MNFYTDFATAKVFTSPQSDLHKEMTSFVTEKGISHVVILDELKLKNHNDFGKGYGKEIFLKLLDTFDCIVACPSFVQFDENDTAYSGREKMTMDNFEEAPLTLLQKFYKPIAEANGFKTYITESTGGQPFILMVKE